MTDIVERLKYTCGPYSDHTLAKDAVDEITRLGEQALMLSAEISGLRRDNERLRGLLEKIEYLCRSGLAATKGTTQVLSDIQRLATTVQPDDSYIPEIVECCALNIDGGRGNCMICGSPVRVFRPTAQPPEATSPTPATP